VADDDAPWQAYYDTTGDGLPTIDWSGLGGLFGRGVLYTVFLGVLHWILVIQRAVEQLFDRIREELERLINGLFDPELVRNAFEVVDLGVGPGPTAFIMALITAALTLYLSSRAYGVLRP